MKSFCSIEIPCNPSIIQKILNEPNKEGFNDDDNDNETEDEIDDYAEEEF